MSTWALRADMPNPSNPTTPRIPKTPQKGGHDHGTENQHEGSINQVGTFVPVHHRTPAVHSWWTHTAERRGQWAVGGRGVPTPTSCSRLIGHRKQLIVPTPSLIFGVGGGGDPHCPVCHRGPPNSEKPHISRQSAPMPFSFEAQQHLIAKEFSSSLLSHSNSKSRLNGFALVHSAVRLLATNRPTCAEMMAVHTTVHPKLRHSVCGHAVT